MRHRLNRNGDRKLNRAMHTIVITRMAHDPETCAYVARRTADGKSRGEIRRCLKRFVARRMYVLLEAVQEVCPAPRVKLGGRVVPCCGDRVRSPGSS